ncbi:MAG: hypothetical protein LBJ84_01100, partial [Oscillospiraceae bacterium]|nr:hypothetical protein [Oscillospiraceae bacterium]
MSMYGISADNPLISMWAKKSHSGEAAWLPLVVHLADTAEAAGRFWELRVSDGEKAMLAEKCRTDEDSVKR